MLCMSFLNDKEAYKCQIQKPTIKMLRTIILLSQTLKNLPERIYLSMKLLYYEDIKFIILIVMLKLFELKAIFNDSYPEESGKKINFSEEISPKNLMNYALEYYKKILINGLIHSFQKPVINSILFLLSYHIRSAIKAFLPTYDDEIS
ncbi:hypothetical protein Avbf_06065 [Armadillidium vulgare]|nr:hypothetical protein Avbf_06065 [Armadillidium vulgare]